MSRPTPVTVVCWVIIAFALESIVGLVSGIAAPLVESIASGSAIPASKAVLAGVCVAIAHIVLAACMLRGAGWARIVYFCIAGLALLGFFLHTLPITILVLLVVKFVVFAFVLFQPDANEYFSRRASA
jgi:uncharacterized membrane protein